MVGFLFLLEKDARTAFSHQELVRKAFSIFCDGPVVSEWYDMINYGQCQSKNYRPICTCSLCSQANDTLSCAKPSVVADVAEMFLSQDNFRKQNSQRFREVIAVFLAHELELNQAATF